ncbi:RDD family protein, partial [Planctomycetota bacterium]
LLYYAVLLAFNTGQTLGMTIVSIRIINENGTMLTLPQALIRSLYMIASFLLFGAGFILPLFRPDRKTLHDLMAKTRFEKV